VSHLSEAECDSSATNWLIHYGWNKQAFEKHSARILDCFAGAIVESRHFHLVNPVFDIHSMPAAELEQRCFIKCWRTKRWKQDDICQTFSQVDGSDPYDMYSIRFWICESKPNREDFNDKPEKGKPTIGDVDVLILHQLTRGSFSSVIFLAPVLKIFHSRIHRL
jgi:hypothetical protein